MLSEHLEPRYRKAIVYRVISLEVGEHMTPGPGRFFVVARTDYLEAPVAGGFADCGAALWGYGLLIDHVAARLAYLDEELFIDSTSTSRSGTAVPTNRSGSVRLGAGL